ncbi:MAG: sulfite exporter TauE/SafE family protein [Lautropia sp.]|nr:sulfite exporter TauE/SafE family protein [Lautropia sp.]
MPDLSLTSLSVLALAAFAAGVLNAIAGGGTFLTFPALVWTGVPPIVANATSAFAVCPGYLGSVMGFRAELAALPRRLLWQEVMLSAAGGVVGAVLLLVTPAKTFAGIVPWLLLFATVLFAMAPRLARRAVAVKADASVSVGTGTPVDSATPADADVAPAPPQASGPVEATRTTLSRALGLLVVAIYGGYFNGGLGILLMALYLLVGESRLNTVNALKNLNSFVLSVVSVITFAVGGAIVWPQALWMAVFATLGGFAGARLARRLPGAWVRGIVIITGLIMAGLFFGRG